MQLNAIDWIWSYYDGRCPLALSSCSPRLYALSENGTFSDGTPPLAPDLWPAPLHQQITLGEETEAVEAEEVASTATHTLEPCNGAGLCVGHVVMYTMAQPPHAALLQRMELWPGEMDLHPQRHPATLPVPARVVHWYDLCPADAHGLTAVAWWWWTDVDGDALPVTLVAHCRSIEALLSALRATDAEARRCIHTVYVMEAQSPSVEAALPTSADAWPSSCDALLQEETRDTENTTPVPTLAFDAPLLCLLQLLPRVRQALLVPRGSSRHLLRHRRCLFEPVLHGALSNPLLPQPATPRAHLARLCLSDCNLRDIAALQHLRHLEELDLSANAELLDGALVDGLSASVALRRLNLAHCTQLSNSPAALVRAMAASLAFLDVSYTRLSTAAVSMMAAVVDCALVYLNLFNCRCVQDVTPLRRLKQLRYLDIRLCPLRINTGDRQDNNEPCLCPLECLLADVQVWAAAPTVMAEVVPTLRRLTLENVSSEALEELCAAGTVNGCCCRGDPPLERVCLTKSLGRLRLGHLGCFPRLRQLRSVAQTVADGGLEGLQVGSDLMRVDLSRCTQLEDLAPMAKLPSLQSLSLVHSDVTDKGLSTLATEGSGVEQLALCECAHVRDLSFLGALECLTVLCVCGTNITDAAVSALGARSRSLVSLDLSYCPGVTRVGALGAIPTLQQLFLAETDLCGDGLDGLAERASLRHLLMPRATRGRQMDLATAVLPLCATLEQLDARGNQFRFSMATETATWHLHTAHVSVLDLSECTAFSQLHLLTALPSLRALKASNTAVSGQDLHDLVRPSDPSPAALSLEVLQLQNCIRLFSVNALAACPALHTLHLSASNVQSDGTRELVRCRRLTCIIADNCKGIHTVGFLGGLSALRVLDVRATNLTSSGLEGLESAPRLHRLLLSGCVGLVGLAGLASLPRLRELHLANCCGLTAQSLADVEMQAALRGRAVFPLLCVLDLSHCTALTELRCDFLAALPYLQELYMDGTPALLHVPRSHALMSRIQ